mmetsp:Transcript_22841/g.38066  ORF Transcript_22841/g.38066 Transcript_22841/m.38066 type:complete len:460 (-) Transcript_22841:17-1396(-)
MAPSVGFSNPANIRIIVVLPQPDGPKRAKNSCAKILSVKLSMAVKSPKRFVTLRNRISGLASGSSQGAKTVSAKGNSVQNEMGAKYPPAPRDRGLGARLDLSPHARHRPLNTGRIGRCGVQVFQRCLVRIDRRIANNVLDQEFLGGGIAVGVVHIVRRLRHVLRIHDEVQELVRPFRIWGVRRNRHLVKPHQRTFAWRVIGHLDTVFGFRRAVAGLKNVTGPTKGHADVTIGQRIDIFRAVEFLHVRGHAGQDRLSLGNDVRVMAVGVFANKFQRRRDHLGRGVEEMHAAGLQFFHIAGVKDQIKRAKRCVRAEDFLHLAHIHADTGGAPHVVDRISVVGVVLRGPRLDHIPKVFGIGQLADVQFLERARSDLALQERARGNNDVIARRSGQHLGLKHFVAVKHVINQVKAGLFLEFCQQLFVDIVGPVVNPHLIGKGSPGQSNQCNSAQHHLFHSVLP